MRCMVLFVIFTANVAMASSYTISSAGIDSKVTGLDGTGIEIGQVEPGRSAKAGFDSDELSASNTKPVEVYFGTSTTTMDANISPHATRVGGVMIGDTSFGVIYEGVAPNANLHSAGFSGDDVDLALTLNHIARLTGPDIRMTAINMSFGREPSPIIEDVDGKSHVTQFMDWSARRHDVLYVAGWPNNDDSAKFLPTDNYNGMTVAASEESDPLFNPGYDKFGSINNQNVLDGDAVGERTSIDILAPGTLIQVLNPDDDPISISGSSEAVPHVTGTVALLQQYAQQQIDAMNPRFASGNPGNSQRHEVMKALMLNSADKLAGVHGSTRTIIDSNDLDWTHSDAFAFSFISLDEQMGAGHLNTRRAVQQFSSGEYGPGMVPLIGWDYGNVGGSGQMNEYLLDQSVADGEYIAVTLAWDRIVNHTGGNTYSAGEQFLPYEDVDDILNNLDVYLVPAEEMGIENAISSSVTFEDNVEHIFFKLGENQGGDYKIVVHHNGGLDTSQNYALAWWYGNPTAPVTGDYDGNGSVGPEDYAVWQSSFGSTTDLDADGNSDDLVNAADYVIWRDNLGAGSGSGAVANVPEPSSLWLFAVAGAILVCRRAAR